MPTCRMYCIQFNKVNKICDKTITSLMLKIPSHIACINPEKRYSLCLHPAHKSIPPSLYGAPLRSGLVGTVQWLLVRIPRYALHLLSFGGSVRSSSAATLSPRTPLRSSHSLSRVGQGATAAYCLARRPVASG